MTYALKARKAAEMAIEHIKAGKKPIIAVDNTLGAYVDEMGEEAVDSNFGAVFDKGVRFALTLREERFGARNRVNTLTTPTVHQQR